MRGLTLNVQPDHVQHGGGCKPDVYEAILRELELSRLDTIPIGAGNPYRAHGLLWCAAVGSGNTAGSHAQVGAKTCSYTHDLLADGLFAHGTVLCEGVGTYTKHFYLDVVRIRDDATEKICGRSGNGSDRMGEIPSRTTFRGGQAKPFLQ